MDTTTAATHRSATRLASLAGALCLASAVAAHAQVSADSLVCAKVTDAYAVQAYTAAFWPKSQDYGDMTWCEMEVKAVEQCVPVEAVVQDTTAPYEGFSSAPLASQFTCYKIRCKNGEGKTWLGSSIPISDSFGARTGSKPRVTRLCIPNH
jgi:hypothetical protein